MRCPKCGANVPDGKSKCPYCFSPIEVQLTPNSGYGSSDYQMPAPQKSVSNVYDKNVEAVAIINNESGTGSGCLISRDGYILTNGHMVYDEDNKVFFEYVQVILEGQKYLGKVVKGNVPRRGYDSEDVALVKIDDPLPYNHLKFGDSSKLRNGDEVIAIGNSLGMGISVSRGIVSDTNKRVGESYLLTSDVSTNKGNSGGPLFNTKGELIAMCVSGMMYAKGMNFFIPVNHILDILRGWGYEF